MARSTYYSAYKYEWTQLINSLVSNSQRLTVDFTTSKEAENQRQEFYGFQRALREESLRAKKANDTETSARFEDLRARASQIAVARRDATLIFQKKSSTDTAKRLSDAIHEQLNPEASEDLPSLDLHEPVSFNSDEGEDTQGDSYSGVLQRTGLSERHDDELTQALSKKYGWGAPGDTEGPQGEES